VAAVRRRAAPCCCPPAVLNYLHFGTPLGAHAAAVLAPIGSAVFSRPVATRAGLVVARVGGRRSSGSRSSPRPGWPRSSRSTSGCARSSPSPAPPSSRARGTPGAAHAVVLAGVSAALLALMPPSSMDGRPQAAGAGGIRRRGGRGSHGHQRRRRAVGHAVPADRGAAAAAPRRAKRHRCGRHRRVAAGATRPRGGDSSGRRRREPERLPRAARHQAQLPKPRHRHPGRSRGLARSS
jgi:hypothetical protein